MALTRAVDGLATLRGLYEARGLDQLEEENRRRKQLVAGRRVPRGPRRPFPLKAKTPGRLGVQLVIDDDGKAPFPQRVERACRLPTPRG